MPRTRKAKRSLPKTLPIIVRQMKAIKEATRKSATVADVVGGTGGLFASENDLGSYLAGAVERMNDAENVKNGTSLHKLAQVVLAKLESTSPSELFSVAGTSGGEAMANAVAAECGIDLDSDNAADAL